MRSGSGSPFRAEHGQAQSGAREEVQAVDVERRPGPVAAEWRWRPRRRSPGRPHEHRELVAPHPAHCGRRAGGDHPTAGRSSEVAHRPGVPERSSPRASRRLRAASGRTEPPGRIERNAARPAAVGQHLTMARWVNGSVRARSAKSPLRGVLFGPRRRRDGRLVQQDQLAL